MTIELKNDSELLHRQVNPSWIVDGIPSSQAFRPTKKDEGQLSVARGSIVSAEEAYVHHTEKLGLGSAGTWSVTVAECNDAGIPVFDDPTDDTPHHASVDFRDLSRRQAEKAGKLLLTHAKARGCTYAPVGGQ